MNMIFLGAGRLATQMAKAMHTCGINITHVYSRTESSAKLLAEKIGAHYTNDITTLHHEDADVWIYALKDDVIETIASQMRNDGALHIHTSGSVDINVFCEKQQLYGSIYPLQTFNIDRDVCFSDIPVFYEGNSEKSILKIKEICTCLNVKAAELNSEKRKLLHLSAVLACNFPNALWAAAENILVESGIDRNVIYPLVGETLAKAKAIGAKNAQTGPASRGDDKIVKSQMELLKNNELLQDIYIKASKLIKENIDNNK